MTDFGNVSPQDRFMHLMLTTMGQLMVAKELGVPPWSFTLGGGE